MVKQTILGHIKCLLLWDVDDKLITIVYVVGHKELFLEQAEGQDVRYSLGVIPYSIGISGEVTNFVGVFSSCVTLDTIFERYFPLMNALCVDWLLRRHQF